MRKNLFVKILALISVFVLSLSFVACGKPDDGGGSQGKHKDEGKKPDSQYTPADFRYRPTEKDDELETADFSVWSVYSTDKIKRDDDRETKFREVYIEGAGGETEGGQLIVTAKKNVNSYTLEVSDLICGNEHISSEDIEIFVQNYINVTFPTAKTHTAPASSPYGTGWYPDALIPYHCIEDFGENNINLDGEASRNQGFWIDVTIPEGTKAGLYTGEIALTLDSKTFVIPLKVNVFGFSIGKAVHAKTAFGIWRWMLPSVYGQDCNADEIYKAYYDFLLKYKVTGDWMPGTKVPASVATVSNENKYVGAAEFAEIAYRYAGREEVNCFEVPGYSATDARPYLEALAKAVINEEENRVEFNIFDKAFLYPYDEPQKDVFDKVMNTTNAIRDMKRELADKLSKEYSDVEGIDDLLDSLVKMDVIVTQSIQPGLMTEYDGETAGGIEAWCPLYDRYGKGNDNGKYYYEAYKALERGESTWWYGCCIPQYPFTNYHTDNSTVGARVLNWQMKDFDVEGNLYWSTNVFMKWLGSGKGPEDTNDYIPRDVWTDPDSFPGGKNPVNGDGYLLYPGNRYNLGNDPIATIRLAAIRDGQEDYEYLYLLDRLIEEANHEFGSSVTMEEMMGDIYDTLYRGVIAKDETEPVFKARREVAGMIEALSGKLKVMATVMRDGEKNGMTRVGVYAPEGAAVKVNGVTAKLSGGNYSACLKLDNASDNVVEIVVEKGGNTTTLYRIANRGGIIIDSLDGNNWSEDEMEVEGLSALQGKGVMFTKEHDSKKTAGSVLAIKDGDFTDFEMVEFYAYNYGEKVVRATFAFTDASGTNEIMSKNTVLRPERWTKVKISVPESGVFNAGSVKSMRVAIDNPPEDEAVSVLIDSIVGVLK